MERLTELEMNSIGIAILCNFPRFCGEERTKEASEMFRAMKDEIMAYRVLGPVEELARGATLVKAQDEGRVVELDTPRKPLVWGDDDHETCLCPDCGADLMGLHYGERIILQCPVCGQYLDTTKAITRAEAEAAQREEGQDDPPKD